MSNECVWYVSRLVAALLWELGDDQEGIAVGEEEGSQHARSLSGDILLIIIFIIF